MQLLFVSVTLKYRNISTESLKVMNIRDQSLYIFVKLLSYKLSFKLVYTLPIHITSVNLQRCLASFIVLYINCSVLISAKEVRIL